jgi:uncharacterized membrane protein YoaK (UPF0700 family)
MWQACVLSAIAGYADAIGYLRFDAFAGLMTGNTILLGIEVMIPAPERALFHLLIIIVFTGGVIVSRGLLQAGAPTWAALTGAALLHVACSFLERGWAAPLLALAMGMQNAAATRFGSVSLNTVFITGNLQKLGEGVIAWCWARGRRQPAPAGGIAIFFLVWLAYAAGAALGAAGQHWLSHPLLVPAAILPFLYAPLRPGETSTAPVPK